MENDVLRGKKLFGRFVCIQRKSLTLGGKGKDNFITISRVGMSKKSIPVDIRG